MRKTLSSVLLGAALLAPWGAARAEEPRPNEPRWAIRAEKSRPPLLDLARWLSERFGRMAMPVEPEPAPVTSPVAAPDPGQAPNVTCLPRDHCPIG